jgi:Flp pilus assembly protein TadG
MTRRPKQLCRASSERSRGQALVEFALVAPLLFLLILGIIEAGRFIFFHELLDGATREGARYAIVHGAEREANGGCSSGPVPGDPDLNDAATSSSCDFPGAWVKNAVRAAALSVVDTNALFVNDPVWTTRGLSNPSPGDLNTGHNGRGNYVTVFLDVTYSPLLGEVFNIEILPDITISAESTLVINY